MMMLTQLVDLLQGEGGAHPSQVWRDVKALQQMQPMRTRLASGYMRS